jgi:membrane protease YdiL (CAAX protease family)
MDYFEQPAPREPHRNIFSQIGLCCFAILFIASALQLGAAYLIAYFKPVWTVRWWFIWAVTFIPTYVLAVPIGILLFRRIPTVTFITKKLRIKDLLIFLIMCFPIMYLGSIAGTLLNNALHALLGKPDRNALSLFLSGSSIWLSALFLVILAPVIEEYIFRRLIIDRLRAYGEGACVLVSALLFGLFHGNFSQFFYAFGLGAVFAFLYVKTGRLRYTIFLHMAINLYGLLSPLLVKAMGLDALFDNANPVRYLVEHLPQLITFMLFIIVIFSLVIAGFVLLIVRRRAFYFERGPLQLGKGTRFKGMFLNLGTALFTAAALALFILSLI